MDRSNTPQGLTADMHDWYAEARDRLYTTKPPDRKYAQIADVRPIEEITGPYFKTTSAIGPETLEKRSAGQPLHQDTPVEGFTVYIVKKSVDKMIRIPYEFDRDWHRTRDFLKTWINDAWTPAIEDTKESLLFDLFNYGGYTSGHDCFNMVDSAVLTSTGYTTDSLLYDSKPFFNYSGNNSTNKVSSTYYNTLTHTSPYVTYENALVLKTLLTATNAKKENDAPFEFPDRGLTVVCPKGLEDDWMAVNNSSQNPDNAENRNNTMKAKIDTIVATNRITTATFSAMGYFKLGLRYYLGKPRFRFWEENDPPSRCASVILDYAIGVVNRRIAVAANAPTS